MNPAGPALALALAAVAGFAGALYLWRYCYAGPSAAKTLWKGLAVAPLVTISALIPAPVALTVGLFLCLLGDLALSRPGERWFLAGMAAFAGGHVAYTVLFFQAGSLPGVTAPGLALATFAALMGWALWSRTGGLRWPVTAYVAVILVMGLAALGLPPGRVGTIAALAAGAFVASDAVLAAEMFLLAEGSRAKRLAPFAVWPLYLAAQWGFVALGFALF